MPVGIRATIGAQMGKRFLYNPFYFDPATDTSLALETAHHEEYKRPILYSRVEVSWEENGAVITEAKKLTTLDAFEGPLALVGDDDILVINAHGSSAKVCLGYRNGKIGPGLHDHRMRILSVTQLAEMIHRDGLRESHRVIKLNSCYAAGNPASSDGRVAIAPKDSFAARLAIELGKRGYTNIMIGGYPGDLDIDERGAGKRIWDAEHKKRQWTTHVERLWFGPDGQQLTEKPAIVKDEVD